MTAGCRPRALGTSRLPASGTVPFLKSDWTDFVGTPDAFGAMHLEGTLDRDVVCLALVGDFYHGAVQRIADDMAFEVRGGEIASEVPTNVITARRDVAEQDIEHAEINGGE